MKWIYAMSLLCWTAGCLVGGCITHPQNPAATQPVTMVDLATTQPSYWLQQPAVGTVTSADFDRLWRTCAQTARNYLFVLDREDYRSGELTTAPLVSAQWFEPWRRDVRTLHDVEESSMATICRTIYFTFTRNGDGTYTMVPRVIVQRQTISEKRITAVVDYTSLFNSTRDIDDQQKGTLESDLNFIIPPRYWYVLGRDPAFEKVLADDVRKQMSD
jgi:hypothetical protein